jgi:Tol biopolymer transport system component
VPTPPERWRQIESLYLSATEQPAERRASWLAEACGENTDLLREVESLLSQRMSTAGILGRGAEAAASALDPAAAPLASGRRIGHYEIVASIGAGGMGEVYRARDLKLRREVAIKILPRLFTEDRDRLSRFEREARVLASLNHPNIATIHGVEESDGVKALVLELVPGETLADRIARTRRAGLAVADALAIARQIAEALDVAHEKSIVHRDLKPANVAVTPEGLVKVLDFGLAKVESRAGPERPSQLSTVTYQQTEQGVILGTAAYMSPEQARGETVDARTDIWAFGAVLYEMLTARPAFAAKTASDTIAAILTREPDWDALSAATPDAIRRLLRRCLQKEATRRLRSIGDARLEIEEALTAGIERNGRASRRSRLQLTTALAGAGAAALVFAGFLLNRDPAPASAPLPVAAVDTIRFPLDPPEGTEFVGEFFTLSPDGRLLAWVSTQRDPPRRSLWVRPLASTAGRELPGTDGASFPFWSPDARSIGFFAQNQLKTLDLQGGAPQTLAPTPAVPLGAAWGAENVIVFSARSALYKVAATGGPIEEVATLDRGAQEDSLRFPRFLPDGRRFLYVARGGNRANSSVYLGSIDGQSKRLFSTTSQVEYSPPGYLLYVRNETLMARRFDATTLELGSETAMLAENVGTLPNSVSAYFTASSNGIFAYQSNVHGVGVLQRFDRAGRALEAVSPQGEYVQFRLRPDGRRIAVTLDDDRDGSASIWTLEPGSTPTRVTFAGTHDRSPIWSPDGNRLVFSSSRRGPYELYSKPVAGAETEEVLMASNDDVWPEDWSADGRFIAYRRHQATTSTDLLVLPMSGDPTPISVAETPFTEHDARFSPDGRWITYVSDEAGGREEVYVQPFPPSGARWQISTEGGDDPVWRPDGRELFYLRPDGTLVSVTVNDRDSTFARGVPSPLFRPGAAGGVSLNRYEVAPDGQSFVVAVSLAPARPQPIVVVINWVEEVKKRLAPTNQ